MAKRNRETADQSRTENKPQRTTSAAEDARKSPGKSPRQTKTLSKKQVIAAFVGLMSAMFVGSLDQTVVGTALPTIIGEVGGVDHMVWVTSAYFLTSSVTMPIYGKLGDMRGRKRLFCLSQTLFIAGSLVCALGSSMFTLIIGRALQGFGGGGSIILSQAIVADIFPPKERGKYMGIMGAAFGVSALVGPLIGGFLTDIAGWRWCFWINLPLAGAALFLAAKCLPNDAHAPSKGTERFDARGTLLMALAASSLVFGISWGGNLLAWTHPAILGLFALAIVAAIAFVAAERKCQNPIIPLKYFRNRTFCLCTAAGLLLAVGMMGVVNYMPTYIQITKGFNATVSAYLMVPMLLSMMVFSTVSGVLAGKLARIKWMLVCSMAFAGLGCALLSTMTASTTVVVMCFFLFLLGCGIGLGQQLLVLLVQNEYSVKEVGTATSANNFFREIGGTIGTTVVGSLFTSGLVANLQTYSAPAGGMQALGIDASSITPALVRSLGETAKTIVANAYNDALTPIFAGMAVALAAGLVLVALIKEKPLKSTND